MNYAELVYEELENAEKPLNRHEVSERLGLPLNAVSSAMHYLAGKHKIHTRDTTGQNKRYSTQPPLVIAAPRMNSVLNAPAWVPPKPLHRPFIDVAPGVVVKRLLTGEVLCAN